MYKEDYADIMSHRSKTIAKAINKAKEKSKKFKYLIIICAVLWSAYIGRLIADNIYYSKIQFSEVFSAIKADTDNCMAEIMGSIGGKSSEKEGFDIIEEMARTLNINAGNIKYVPEDTTYILSLMNGQSETVLKCVELNGQRYAYARITIYGSGVCDIAAYKSKLEKYFNSNGIGIISSRILYTGEYPGRLDTKEKDSIAKKVFEKLSAKENGRYTNEENIYTIYGYSSGMEEYVLNNGIPVNVQVSAYYDEISNRTVIYVGSPIINIEY